MSLPHAEVRPATADGFALAGGLSSRMGRDKALTSLGTKPLILHALETLRAAGLEPRIAGARTDLSSFAATVLDDPSTSGRGPLSGICTALAAGTADFGVFFPVDLPLLPSGLIAYLLHYAALTQSAVTLVSVAAFVQTFPVVICREALPHLRASLQSNRCGCLGAFREAAKALSMPVSSRPFSALPLEMLIQSGHVSPASGIPASDWFLNVNSPSDLARAEVLLARNPHQVS